MERASQISQIFVPSHLPSRGGVLATPYFFMGVSEMGRVVPLYDLDPLTAAALRARVMAVGLGHDIMGFQMEEDEEFGVLAYSCCVKCGFMVFIMSKPGNPRRPVLGKAIEVRCPSGNRRIVWW